MVFGNLVAVPFEEQRVGVIRIRLCDFPLAKAVASEMVVDIDDDQGPSLVNDVDSVDSLLDGVIQIGSEGIELLAKGLGKIWLVLAVLPIAPGDTITVGNVELQLRLREKETNEGKPTSPELIKNMFAESH